MEMKHQDGYAPSAEDTAKLNEIMTWLDNNGYKGIVLIHKGDIGVSWMNETDAEAIGREVLRRLRERYAVRPPVTERHDAVLYAAIQATGRQLTATRNPADTLIRAMVAHRLRKEGYSNSEIGRAMGRDHSSVTHLDKKMRDMLSVPGAYKDEMRIYEKFESLC